MPKILRRSGQTWPDKMPGVVIRKKSILFFIYLSLIGKVFLSFETAAIYLFLSKADSRYIAANNK